jgi:hypothetical protein
VRALPSGLRVQDSDGRVRGVCCVCSLIRER